MDRYRKAVALSIIAMVAIGVAGCRTVEPGVEWRVGTLRTVVNATPDEVIGAAEQAVDDLNLVLVSSTASRLEGELIARTAQDERITIRAEQAARAGETGLSIRVGRLGDEPRSRRIHEAIMEHLGEGAMQPRGLEQPEDRQAP